MISVRLNRGRHRYLCQGKTTATLHLKPYTWGNQRGARSHQGCFLAPLPGTPLFEIGELHAFLHFCFFSLVSLPFSFCFSSPFCLVKHVRIWCFEGIGSSRFPSKGWRKYEEGMG